ncbi:LacI family DNA-binding transcriptional regulator [Cellulosilyticum sp. I15G10I2]|uniref:LacI family DNA-binding transcriptional regulator n=1 Tax=Cellulosilyticum sp. I15G10I2 TaxID=1892843 RepID=UPI00085C2307|nr:LacI family DNA-binding transcriptional regulator [Cellulosilyticum sp. I15G10I2]
MATIRDIARLAEVSPATVSRVLNLDESISVSLETKKRIFEVAENLSYQKPNRSPKSTSNNLNIGLIHCCNELQELNDPYFLSIRIGIDEECKTNNLNLHKVYKDDVIANHFPAESLDGMILLGRFEENQIDIFRKYSDNIVFLHGTSSHFEFDSVQVDFRQITRDVLDYLIAKGHTKIAYIGGREKVLGASDLLTDDRESEFIDYLSRLNLYNPSYIRVGHYDFKDGYELMHSLIKANANNLPSCVFMASDSLAIGGIRALNELGLSIPETISIIGCNDIPASQYTSPTLSTIKIYTKFMGELGVKLLLEQINDIRKEKIKVTIPHKLIVRESC